MSHRLFGYSWVSRISYRTHTWWHESVWNYGSTRLSSAQTPQGIGRWTIHYDQSIVDRNINWANEDNCGVCNVPSTPVVEIGKEDNDIIEMIGCYSEVPSSVKSLSAM